MSSSAKSPPPPAATSTITTRSSSRSAPSADNKKKNEVGDTPAKMVHARFTLSGKRTSELALLAALPKPETRNHLSFYMSNGIYKRVKLANGDPPFTMANPSYDGDDDDLVDDVDSISAAAPKGYKWPEFGFPTRIAFADPATVPPERSEEKTSGGSVQLSTSSSSTVTFKVGKQSTLVLGSKQKEVAKTPTKRKRATKRKTAGRLRLVPKELEEDVNEDRLLGSLRYQNISHGVQPRSSAASPKFPICDQIYQGKGNHYSATVLPPRTAKWFSWTAVHPIERAAFPELFVPGNVKRGQEVYMTTRNALIQAYLVNPTQRLSVRDAMLALEAPQPFVVALHTFLDEWGVINYHITAPGEARFHFKSSRQHTLALCGDPLRFYRSVDKQDYDTDRKLGSGLVVHDQYTGRFDATQANHQLEEAYPRETMSNVILDFTARDALKEYQRRHRAVVGTDFANDSKIMSASRFFSLRNEAPASSSSSTSVNGGASQGDKGGDGEVRGLPVLSCSVCQTPCQGRYHASRHLEYFVLCETCYLNGKYPSMSVQTDFELRGSSPSVVGKAAAPQVSKDLKEPWAGADTLRLLDGILRTGADWHAVAEYVKTHNADECLVQFVRQGIEDSAIHQWSNTLGVEELKRLSHRNSKTKMENFAEAFLGLENPTLSYIACISSMISPAVGAAAAKAVLRHLMLQESQYILERSEGLTVQTPFGEGRTLEYIPQKPKNATAFVKVQLSYGVAFANLNSVTIRSLPEGYSVTVPFSCDHAELIRIAAKAAAATAQDMALAEERHAVKSMVEAIQAQLDVVHLKLTHLQKIDRGLEDELLVAQQLHHNIFSERQQIDGSDDALPVPKPAARVAEIEKHYERGKTAAGDPIPSGNHMLSTFASLETTSSRAARRGKVAKRRGPYKKKVKLSTQPTQ